MIPDGRGAKLPLGLQAVMRVDKKEGGRWKKRQTESDTTRKEFTLRMRERERDGGYKESRKVANH